MFGFVYLLLAFFWFVTLPLLIIGVAAYLRFTPTRPLAALMATGWCSLLVGVGGIAWYVAVGHDDPACLL